jgi:N utilization substance protein B
MSRTRPRPEDGSATTSRGRGRELAFLVMCHLESYPAAEHARARELLWSAPPRGEAEGEGGLSDLVADEKARTFADRLLDAWSERREAVDARIEATSRTWRLARMDRVDRNLVRLAATELEALAETPRSVVVAEAVRLADRYGSERSAPFVNGLVEALARMLRDADGGSEPA